MKFIFMLFMLTSLLFSGQKQIILGSYLVQSNGKRALETLDKQIQNDIQLQDFMKDNSLRTINTVISGYTVVSINAFTSYRELLNTINVFKVYYGDAFVLKYPTKNIQDFENIQDVEAKAREEQMIEDRASTEKKELEVVVVINKKSELVQNEDKVNELKKDHIQKEWIEEETISESLEKEETSHIEKYVMYLILLAVFALLAAAITVFKIANSNTKKQVEND